MLQYWQHQSTKVLDNDNWLSASAVYGKHKVMTEGLNAAHFLMQACQRQFRTAAKAGCSTHAVEGQDFCFLFLCGLHPRYFSPPWQSPFAAEPAKDNGRRKIPGGMRNDETLMELMRNPWDLCVGFDEAPRELVSMLAG